MSKRYWLMKSEPGEFSIDDLKESENQTAHWDGVRNYQARNFMRDEMKEGDRVLFYHSGKNPSVAGLATVVKEGYPDHTAWDEDSDYHDPKSSPDNPAWYMVDIRFDKKFPEPVPLKKIREVEELENMMLFKNMRLTVIPVKKKEFEIIVSMTQDS